MKKILLILLLLPFIAGAQVKQTYNQYGGKWKRLVADSAWGLPKVAVGLKDQNLGFDTAQIRYNIADSSVYVHTGSGWILLRGAGATTPTWQQTLTAGSTLNQNNSINVDGNDLEFTNGANFEVSPTANNNSSHILLTIGSNTVAENRSVIDMVKDTIKINAHTGTLIVDSLNYTLLTTRKKIMLRDTATGLVQNIDPALLGGNFILNQTSQQASSNFNISGTGVIGNKLQVNGSADQTTVTLVVQGEASDNMLIGIKKPDSTRYDAMMKFDGYTDPTRHEGGFSWWSGDDLNSALVKKMTLWPRGKLYIGDALSNDDSKDYKLSLYGHQGFHNDTDRVYWGDKPTIGFPVRSGTNGLNTFFGSYAGDSIRFVSASTGDSSSFNTGFGAYTLRKAKYVSYSTAVGATVFPELVSGLWMTAIGSGAGNAQISGESCTYTGADVAYYSPKNYYATMSGHFTGQRTDSTYHNTLYGYDVADTLYRGDGNTIIGSQAADNLRIGSENIILGHGGATYETGSNKFFVNNYATRGGSEATARTTALLYGVMNATTASQTLTVNGMLGVNNIPSANLDVTGTASVSGALNVGGQFSINSVWLFNESYGVSNNIVLRNNGTGNTAFNITNTGNMTVGDVLTAGTEKLTVIGSTKITDLAGTGTRMVEASSAGVLSATQIVTSGTYTPTRSAEVNTTGNAAPTVAQYLRVGNTVTVSGRFTVLPTLTATATSFEMTLPIASNIGAVEDAAGTAFCGTIAGMGGELKGSIANNTVVISWISTDITSKTWSYTFTYQII